MNSQDSQATATAAVELPELTAIPPVDEVALARAVQDSDKLAHNLPATVETETDYVAAGELRVAIDSTISRIREILDPVCSAANAAHKAATGARSKMTAPLEAAKARVTGAMERFLSAQRQREEAARRDREAADLRAAENARLERAAELQSHGRAADADRLLEAPVQPAPAVVKPDVPKVSGVRTKQAFSFSVVDVASVKPAFMIPDAAKIQKLVDALGMEAAEHVGGIVVSVSDKIAGAARRGGQ